MKGSAECGANWEIKRGFVAPDKALQAGEQAILLVDNHEKTVWLNRVEYSPPGQEGITFTDVYAWSTNQYPRHPNTVVNHPEEAEIIKDLLDIHRRAAKIAVGRVTSFGLLDYQPGGHTRRHRDRVEGDTIAVSLTAEAECQIKDPVTRNKFSYIMNPGDALYLVNPRIQRYRPLHKVINISNERRISLVV